jgi:hypothetical protein
MAAATVKGTIIRQMPSEYSPIFSEPEEPNCFSIITQVNIRETKKKCTMLKNVYISNFSIKNYT